METLEDNYDFTMNLYAGKSQGILYCLPPRAPEGNIIADVNFKWSEAQVQAWKKDKTPPKVLQDVLAISHPVKQPFLGMISFSMTVRGSQVMSGTHGRMIKSAPDTDAYIWSVPGEMAIVVPKGALDLTKFFPDCEK